MSELVSKSVSKQVQHDNSLTELQVFLFERWLEDGLGSLTLEVSISCGALMVICKLLNWRIGRLASGTWDVQRQLQILLLRKYLSMDELDLKVSK